MPYPSYAGALYQLHVWSRPHQPRPQPASICQLHHRPQLNELARNSALFRIEVYRKYTQSVAVLLMFLIGAPLGSIIKKGGLGVPILISILFFIVYYVLSIMGEKYGREFVMPVGIGMWLSNLVLLPAGLFFLYQAYNDSGLLELDFWRRLPQKLGHPGAAQNHRAGRGTCRISPVITCLSL